MKGKQLLIISLLITFTVFITACNSNSSSGSTTTEDGKVVVNFWHSMGGHNLTVLEDIIDEYNKSQEEVAVEPIYQGSYREGFTKINSIIGTDEVPALMQLNEESTKPMIDLGYITPMQDFLDKDGFDISTFEPHVLGRYEVDGKLYSMPFNPSLAIVYYNKDAFKEVGLDPNNPPHTYSEYEDAAEQLTIRNGSNVERYGINIRNFGWHFEQLRINQGGYTVNNENGRAAPATEATINSEEMERAISWIKSMYDKGIYGNFGRSGDDARDAFYEEKTAIFVDSSSTAVPTIQNAPFEVGIAKYPVPDGVEPHGSVIGGASLWIFDEVSQETQDAAWDFIKYLIEPETQAKWATGTGYFPVSQEVYETDTYKEYLDEYPEFQTALDQLHLGEVSPITQGAYIGSYPDIRIIVEDMFENVLEDNIGIQEGLEEANDSITEVLKRYEQTEGSN